MDNGTATPGSYKWGSLLLSFLSRHALPNATSNLVNFVKCCYLPSLISCLRRCSCADVLSSADGNVLLFVEGVNNDDGIDLTPLYSLSSVHFFLSFNNILVSCRFRDFLLLICSCNSSINFLKLPQLTITMPREEVYGTGKQEIRTAAKVDLSTHAASQSVLHVSAVSICGLLKPS